MTIKARSTATGVTETVHRREWRKNFDLWTYIERGTQVHAAATSTSMIVPLIGQTGITAGSFYVGDPTDIEILNGRLWVNVSGVAAAAPVVLVTLRGFDYGDQDRLLSMATGAGAAVYCGYIPKATGTGDDASANNMLTPAAANNGQLAYSVVHTSRADSIDTNDSNVLTFDFLSNSGAGPELTVDYLIHLNCRPLGVVQ
jgi:hypothetical protein